MMKRTKRQPDNCQNDRPAQFSTNLSFSNCQKALVPLKTDDELDLFQINLHHSLQCNIALKLKCKTEQTFLYAIQEPYQDKYFNFTDLQGGNNCIISKTKEKVRSAILHSRNLPIIPVTDLCTKDVTVAMLKIRKKNMAFWQHENIIIISAYWDILKDNVPNALINALQ